MKNDRNTTGVRFNSGSSFTAKFAALYPLIAALAILVISSCARDGVDPITNRELEIHAEYLASDALEGRETGSKGIAGAENYIAEHFASIGLEPLPDEEDFFLEFFLYASFWLWCR